MPVPLLDGFCSIWTMKTLRSSLSWLRPGENSYRAARLKRS
jgi:hypothetical protein